MGSRAFDSSRELLEEIMITAEYLSTVNEEYRTPTGESRHGIHPEDYEEVYGRVEDHIEELQDMLDRVEKPENIPEVKDHVTETPD